MDSLTVFLLVCCCIALIIYWASSRFFESSEFPPGPKGLPVVGSLLDLSSNPPQQLMGWSKRFGDTISVRMGSRTMVVMHDDDTARSVLNEENSTGRDQEFIFNKFFKNRGLLQSEGDLWKEHRRFALSALRDLGMGKSWQENAILDEVLELVAVFKRYGGTTCNPRPHLTVAVSNVICALIFGKRFEHSDTRFLKLCSVFGENVRMLNTVTPVEFFPILKYIPFGKIYKTWGLFFENIHYVKNFVQSLVAEHVERLVENKEEVGAKGDYIDSYLVEREKHRRQEKASSFTDEQLTYSVVNLFAAGTETTTSTLLWGILFMAENPEVQRKVQEEIDREVGSRSIRMIDKVFLKYTDAVTLEIQRLGSVVPLSVMHTNFDRMTIDGFQIPPRTIITINSYAMHRNPRNWSHPDVLYPEHFLDQGGAVKIPKGFAPFGIGKRACIGESLAKMEIFLFFTNLLQQFRIVRGGAAASSDNFSIGLVRSPLPFEVSFHPRLPLAQTNYV